MQTWGSARLRALLFSPQTDTPTAGSSLGFGILKEVQGAMSRRAWPPLLPKPGSTREREAMWLALKHGEEIEIASIGQGIHRPYCIRFKSGVDSGPTTTVRAVLKTVHFQYENIRYRETVDVEITGPEREVLSYELDRTLGFDLVPPTVGREVEKVGFGSLQAWVRQPTAWQWIERGYDYREDVRNPWLHRLAAFDFIRGEIDRHANNWIMDSKHRVYAIDNGYSIPDGDNRKWFRSSAGKALRGTLIHPIVAMEIAAIDESRIKELFKHHRFNKGECEGVLKRVQELKELKVWRKLGRLW